MRWEVQMRIGVAYYPEQWPEDRWAHDALLMKQTGIDVVRLAEFAWSRLEPRRGQYDTEWLQRAIDVLAEHGLQTIMCTPTAAPPTWLFNRHPQMVPVDQLGRQWHPGSRRHACLNSRPYRRYVRRIVRETAKALATNPNVVAWQIDNEIGCHGSGRCYCEDCEQAFREWLKKRYGTIERLNKLWGSSFWSQEFNDWIFIPAPRRTPAGVHPSLALDYERFMTATARDFVQEQRQIIEDYGGKAPITTNCLGTVTDQINQFSLAGVLDVAAYDNYPCGGDAAEPAAFQLDLARSVKRQPFWVMEQQSGPTLIPTAHARPRPGKLHLWSWQAAARGAELVAYFRWRTCGAGQEMHWHGILDANGAPSPRYSELRETIAEIKEHASLWEGRAPQPRVGLVLDYDSHWALKADSMAAEVNHLDQVRACHTLLTQRGISVDLIAPEQPLADYSAVLALTPLICRQQTAARWSAFVEAGGMLLVTAPAGYRTAQNTWVEEQPPAQLAPLLGVAVREVDALGPGGTNIVVMDGQEFQVDALCSILTLQDADAVGTYAECWYAGEAAVTRHEVGKGTAYFLGSAGNEGLLNALLERLISDAGLAAHPWASQTVEVIPLGPGQDRRAFVLNHAAEPTDLPLEEGQLCRDLLSGTEHCGSVKLPADGVALLQW